MAKPTLTRTALATALAMGFALSGSTLAADAAAQSDRAAQTTERDSAQPVTDTWITTKAKSALLADDSVSGLDLEVETANGVVTLGGDVENQRQLTQARAIVQGIEGVRRVETSGLRVGAAMTDSDRNDVTADRTARNDDDDRNGRDSTQPITDTWITTKVKSALLADDDVSGLDIDVETANGVVMLTGDIENQNQLAEARQIARGIEGVSRVETNGLRVDPNLRADANTDRATTSTMRGDAGAEMGRDAADGRDSGQPVTDTWITTKVKSALLADDDVSGLAIDVDTANGVVTLEGDVQSQRQIAEAREIARGIEGVTRVDTAGLRVDADANAGTATAAGAGVAARTDRDADMTRDRTMQRATADRTDDDMDVTGADDSAQPVTDTWITTKVKSALVANDDVSGLDISVETHNGVVMLTGSAESQAQVRRATALARAVEGVTRVDASGLEAGTRKTAATGAADRAVGDGASLGASDQPVDDTWITTKVKSSLLADDIVSGLALSVQTVNGVVSLQGDVESQAQIDRATRIVETIEGVRDVNAEGLRLESGQARR